MALYIGLMSGTSLDGVDGVLAEFPSERATSTIAHVHVPFAPALREQLLALNSPGEDEIHRAALAGNAVSRAYAAVVASLLETSRMPASRVVAIGAHGQTVRHRPLEFDGRGYTTQLLDAAGLAEACGIDVVCDFRNRDVAAGGQGAPLVPAFHAAMFGDSRSDIAVLNVGGIANLTLIPAAGAVRGFDCGPGNVLMDLWIARHLGLPFDAGGAWAASGRVHPGLLEALLAEPFLRRSPPKSTGRDLFNAAWLEAHLPAAEGVEPADVMATLCEFTARAAADALAAQQPGTATLLVCGGGAFNQHLMARLRSLGVAGAVASTLEAGMAPDQVEALAFAWLAREFSARRPGNLPEVTGARGLRVLGALYPA